MAEKIRYTFSLSKSGEKIPAIALASGESQSLHSMIDPIREAQRLISSITDDIGFFIFLGLGGGFAPAAALEKTNAQIIVIDFDRESVRCLLDSKDYSKILNCGRVKLLTDPSDEEIKNNIKENYNPSLNGGIKTIPLRTRTEQSQAEFEKAVLAVQQAIEEISGDYSVQSYFGIRWFSNIIRNIINIGKNGNDFFLKNKKNKNIAVVAAGPSLDRQITSLKEKINERYFIISCDTALPVLLHNGIKPDAVVSIDCQHISYYHFLGCDIKDIPLILDIASPPSFYDLSASSEFFISGHPLARYIYSCMDGFIQLDTSGGNVTYTCLSLAEYLGAGNIIFFGADFSYINSQTYAKGAYIYPYFDKKQSRHAPLEAQASALLYRSAFLPPEDTEKFQKDACRYYETSPLRFYRKKLEEKINTINTDITFAKGDGAPVAHNKQKIKNDKPEIKYKEPENKNRRFSGRIFLEQYRDDIMMLPAFTDDYLSKLNSKERQIFTTILPLTAAVKKRSPQLKQKDLIEEAKNLSVNKIEKALL